MTGKKGTAFFSLSSIKIVLACCALIAVSALCAFAAAPKILKGHESDVWAVTYSPKGDFLASAGKDNSIIIWKLPNYDIAYTLKRHTKAVTSLAFSPNGTYLASSGRDSLVVIWRVEGFRPALDINAHKQSVFSVAFSPDSKFLATASLDDSIRIWRNIIFRPVKTLEAQANALSTAFSPDNKFLASGNGDGTIKFWDTKNYLHLKTIQAHDGDVLTVAFSPDNRFIASGGKDGLIKIWSMPDMAAHKTMADHKSPVLSLAFSPDGKYLASAGEDKLIRIWSLPDFKLSATMASHENNVDAVAFSPDSKNLASASEDKTVRIWTSPFENTSASPVNSSAVSASTIAVAAALDIEQKLGDYKKHYDAAMLKRGTGFLGFIKDYDAYQEFQQAARYNNTPDVRSKIEQTYNSFRFGAIKVAVIVLVLLGATIKGATVLIRRKKGGAKPAGPADKFNALLSASKFSDALKLYGKTKKNPALLEQIPPETIFAIFAGAGKAENLAQEQLPGTHFAEFARKALAAADIKLAGTMFDRFKALATDIPSIQHFSEDELVAIYTGKGILGQISIEKISPAKILDCAKQLADQGKADEALGLVGDGKTISADQNITPENAATLTYIFEKAGKLETLLQLLSAEKFQKTIYAAAAEMFKQLTKKDELAKTLELLGKHYPETLDETGSKNLIAAYADAGKLEQLSQETLPGQYRFLIAEMLASANKHKEALDALNKIPADAWTEHEYHLCMRLYEKLDMCATADELMDRAKEKLPLPKAPEFYYDFALCCEKAGKNERAAAVYKEFAEKGVTFRDTEKRLAALQEKLTPQKPPEQPLQPAPAINEATQIITAPQPAQTAPSEQTQPQTAPSAVATATSPAEFKPQTKSARLDEDAMRIASLKGGKMELVKELGRGGMGIVYSVFDKSLNRKVAVKRMREEFYMSKKEVEKFLNEARMVAQLTHPNIVIVYEIIEQEEMTYILFEYVDGLSLEQTLESAPRGIPFNEASRILEQICNGLSYAHNHNIIHRDLKPSNILIASDGLVKITDFGIARMAKDTILRLTGASTGTLAYMAPEQELGTFDARSDIYSMGVVLYEILTGELPFRGPNFYLQKEKMVHRSIRELVPELPPRMDEIIDKCLDADPDKRYSTVDELLRDIVSIS